jgi:hypothetical protein
MASCANPAGLKVLFITGFAENAVRGNEDLAPAWQSSPSHLTGACSASSLIEG